MEESSTPVTRSKPETGSSKASDVRVEELSTPVTRSKMENKACAACGEVCECVFGRMRAERGKTRNSQVLTPEVSPAKKQRKGVKVVPSRKRCKAIESVAEEIDRPSPEKNKPVAVDLRSEARIAAEENSRLSKGKQIHPFFASRSSAKKTVEISGNLKIEEKNKNPVQIENNELSFCPPIHVLDTEKCKVKLDWSNWAFKEKSVLEKSSISILETSSLVKVKPSTLETNGVVISKVEISSDLNAVCDSSKVSLPSSCRIPFLYDLEKENENLICNTSLQTDSSLWTDKYQPENSYQVCGNTESVNFLSEWLKLWHEKGRKICKKPQFLQDISIEESENSWYNGSDMDQLCEEQEEENDFQNVLLITGPVGSGKSAAVYACAKEQGFNIVEVSASDFRNGAHIKQKFGEATESHGLDKWSREEILGGNNIPSTSISLENNDCNNNKVIVNKTLVLFEDVDTVFDEDKGFIATILQLADTTKWPIVLTSNNKNPVLPKTLNHLILEFNRPSSEELLSYLDKICTSEKTEIPIPLIKHAINSCSNDIRKSIILLQFWCQGTTEYLCTKENTNNIPFEIDAIYSILPKALNFGFHCDLSEKIYTEINQAISSFQTHLLQIEYQNLINLNFSPIKTPKKRKSKLKKNKPIPESPIPNLNNYLNDFNSPPKTPLPISKNKSGKKRALIFSDSEEEICTNSQVSQNNSPLKDSTRLHLGLLSDNANDPFGFNSSPSRICDTFISVVPESLCDTVSVNWNFNEGTTEKNNNGSNIVLMNVEFIGNVGMIERNNNNKNNENNMNIEASVSNTFEARNVVMDECSSAEWNFNNNTNNINNTNNYTSTSNNNDCYNNGDTSLSEIGSVKETWERLKDKSNDLKNCVQNNCREGNEILRLTSCVSDLVSETDILFSDCNPLIYDKMDESLLESNDISCNETLFEIGSVYARHGLGLYLNNNSSNNNTVFESKIHLSKEILISSNDSNSIGKLLRGANSELFNKGDLSANLSSGFSSERRQKESCLYDAIFSLVPPKLAISLKGPSFHEYTSSISQISRLEFSRLSETEMRFLNRRSRARHYLTCGKLQLSTEEAELFAKCNSFNENK